MPLSSLYLASLVLLIGSSVLLVVPWFFVFVSWLDTCFLCICQRSISCQHSILGAVVFLTPRVGTVHICQHPLYSYSAICEFAFYCVGTVSSFIIFVSILCTVLRQFASLRSIGLAILTLCCVALVFSAISGGLLLRPLHMQLSFFWWVCDFHFIFLRVCSFWSEHWHSLCSRPTCRHITTHPPYHALPPSLAHHNPPCHITFCPPCSQVSASQDFETYREALMVCRQPFVLIHLLISH